MEMKLSFKNIRAKKKPNGSSSITVFGQSFKNVDISVNEQGVSVAGSNPDYVVQKEVGNK